jgi:hypothetical protein
VGDSKFEISIVTRMSAFDAISRQLTERQSGGTFLLGHNSKRDICPIRMFYCVTQNEKETMDLNLHWDQGQEL